MSRLIDDAVLKASIEQGKIVIDEDVLKCETMHDMLCYLLKKVEDFMVETIDSQPTAFSIEAVVRELEESYRWNMEMYDKYNNIVFETAADTLKDAIEIVKRGGRNE